MISLSVFSPVRFTKSCLFFRYFLHSKVFFCTPNSCFNVLRKRKLQNPRGLFVLSSGESGFARRHLHVHSVENESANKQCGSTNCRVLRDNQVLYRFRWIKQLRFISRAKIVHVAVVVSLIWPTSYWYSSGLVSLPTLSCAIAGAVGTTVGLVAISYFFRRVVGELSIDEVTQNVTISSLTFWGNRRNATFPLSSLVPLSDTGIDMKNTFHRLELYGSKEVYLLNLRHCKIFDEMFCSVIGLPVHQTDRKTAEVASKK